MTLFVFSPYIVIEKNISWLAALKESVAVTQKNLINTVFKIFVFTLVFIIISSVAMLIAEAGILGTIIGLLLYILIFLYINAFPFALYLDLKNTK